MADFTVSSAVDTFMQAASQAAMLSALNITLGGAFATSGAFTTTLTVTGNTNVTLPTAGTLAILGANTFTAAQIFSVSGVASTPTISLTGTPYAGNGTTSFPLLYLNQNTATASTTLNTAGTFFGINSHGTQDLFNAMVDGVTAFKLASDGRINAVANPGFPQYTMAGANGYGMRVYADRVDFWIASSAVFTIQAGVVDMGSGTFAWSTGVRLNQPTTNTLAMNSASATPVTMTLSGTQGVGSNITGGMLNIGTRGTGTGTGGVINLQTHAAGASSSTLGTLVTVLSVKGIGLINIANIPTSSAGLVTGDIYSNAGILTIV